MDVDPGPENLINFGTTIEEAKTRCESVIDTIESLPNLNPSCKHTLFRLIQSEVSFLSRFSSIDFTETSEPSICVNIGHLEAVVHILKHPNISGVSRVCKTIGVHNNNISKRAHVDIVCTFNRNPVWFIVSDRNPKYISWYEQPESSRNKGLRARVHLLLEVANFSISLKPTSIIFFFSNGLDRFTLEKFRTEFSAIDVRSKFSNFKQASVLEIKVACSQNLSKIVKIPLLAYPSGKPSDLTFYGSFIDLISQMNRLTDSEMINFDTTALIAIISGISNGNSRKLLATPEDELKIRFKGNTEFVIGQAMSEIQSPIHTDIRNVISGKKGVICESVFSEFNELVLMCGGVNEKLRAGELLKYLVVVPDSPSGRMMSLPTSRKLAMKNKIVFGTGDYWRAPTLTANMGFVRAVLQTGMSLFTYEHRPRALTGD